MVNADAEVPDVDLWEAYTAACECGCPVLIRSPGPQRGDTFECPECKTICRVVNLCASIRKDKTPQRLEVLHLPFLE